MHSAISALLASASDNVVHIVTMRWLHQLKEPCSAGDRVPLVGDARSTHSCVGVTSLAQRLSPYTSKGSSRQVSDEGKRRAIKTRIVKSRRRVAIYPAKGDCGLPSTWHEGLLDSGKSRGTCERGSALEDRLTHDLNHFGLVAAMRLSQDHVVTGRRLLHLRQSCNNTSSAAPA